VITPSAGLTRISSPMGTTLSESQKKKKVNTNKTRKKKKTGL